IAAAAGRPSGERVSEPGTEVVPLLSGNGDPNFEQDVRRLTLSLGLLGLLILLVTCTNVSALLTGLAMVRRQEIAVRLSLGAPRARIIRQLLTESVLLAVTAGAATLGIVWAVLRAVNTAYPRLPLEVGVTWLVAAFTFGVALAVGLLFGLAPALHATRAGIGSAMRDSTTGIAGTRLRLQRALVVAQIALTQPLVVGVVAVLLIVVSEFQPASRNRFAEQLVSVQLRPAMPTGGASSTRSELLDGLQGEIRRLHARLEATPGVAAAAFSSEPAGEFQSYFVHPEDRVQGGPQAPVRLSGNTAPPGYFSVAGIPLLRGRELTPADAGYERDAAEVPVVIGGDLARRLWSGADPVGRRLQPAGDSVAVAPTLVVVGVAADPDAGRRDSRKPYPVYVAPDTAAAPSGLLVRTRSDAQPLVPTIRRTVQEEAPGLVADVQTVAAIEEESRKTFRAATGGLLGSALLALFLSAIGLYAVVAFSVGQRASEIAVRMTVGARPRQIAGRFIADGVRLSTVGLAIGLPVSVIGLRFVNSIPDDSGLPQVPLGPVVVLGLLGVLAVAAAASLVPARRAASTDPAQVLRRT
ncbi:MAG TPA: FtsX-like permease family protein, partial [Longimicrobiaceae bacterium]|nr:FtsX-like permease family protein [Longimicrobiaceae bacterium]